MGDYFAVGGGEALELARSLDPAVTLEQLEASGLRGRGGAGYPTASKWRSVMDGGAGDRYVVCNAAEGEPGTFKDRALLRANPFQVIEGLLVAAVTLGARTAYVALKSSFERESDLNQSGRSFAFAKLANGHASRACASSVSSRPAVRP